MKQILTSWAGWGEKGRGQSRLRDVQSLVVTEVKKSEPELRFV